MFNKNITQLTKKSLYQPSRTVRLAITNAKKENDCKENDFTKALEFIDPNAAEASDACKVKNYAEEAFFKDYYANTLLTQFQSDNSTSEIKKLVVTLGTCQTDSTKKQGHLYGIHSWGSMVDKPDSEFEYPVGKDIVILSLPNTQTLDPNSLSNIQATTQANKQAPTTPTENYIGDDGDEYPKAFLTSHDGGNFKGQIDDSCMDY